MAVDYKGERVRLFAIQYKNANRWTLLLTTDLQLSFVQAIEIYQIRWTIEVLFKECKQYLRLGACQNTDFDAQIADATITLITHTILSLQKRFGSYETMGELFRQTQQYLLELTLWERFIKLLVRVIEEIIELFGIEIDELMEKLMLNDHSSRKLVVVLSALDIIADKSPKMS